jgi:antitoxin (DNA-binding transcriptional repressor) of toxin-antitoxin stability system
MEKVSISEIKNRLSAYLRKVRAGQVVIIMDRDQPVARLERIAGNGHHDDRLRRLEQAGLVRRASKTLRRGLLAGSAPKATHSVLDALLEDRRNGR